MTIDRLCHRTSPVESLKIRSTCLLTDIKEEDICPKIREKMVITADPKRRDTDGKRLFIIHVRKYIRGSENDRKNLKALLLFTLEKIER